MSDRLAPRNTDEYIATFSPEVQSILEKIRSTIREAVPGAEEKLSYQMPAFTLDGDLIYFAAFKKHIGLYPPVMGDENLRKVTSRYKGEKGNLKFLLDEPVEFYKRAFGATELFRLVAPSGEIGHAEIRIGDSTVMLDNPRPHAQGAQRDRSFLRPDRLGPAPRQI